MKKVTEIKDKEVLKAISKNEYYSQERFIEDAKAYIKAIKERRMLCVITNVSPSGMSRSLKFHSYEKSYYRQYWAFFKALGYREAKDRNAFVINGCGMDMIFHTNYTIIHRLFRLGFITKVECDDLAQQTPTNL
jgi:hypothetical protein